MHLWFPNIRLALEILPQLFSQPFELPSSHVFKIYPVRPRRRRFVKKNRYSMAFPDFVAHAPRQRHAILNGDAIDGNKWQHIRRADPWMRARVFRQVDQLPGLARSQMLVL